MLQAHSENFRKKRIELEVSYGKKVTFTDTDCLAVELIEYLKKTKNIEIHLDFFLNLCAICEIQWTTGDFAKETLLMIPKPSKHQGEVPKVRVKVPRVVCLSCSETLSTEDGVQRIEAHAACTLEDAWHAMLGNKRPKVSNFVLSAQSEITPNSVEHSTSSKTRGAPTVHCGGRLEKLPAVHSTALLDYERRDRQLQTSQQQEGEILRRDGEGESVTSTSDNLSSSSGGESLQDMVDQKGFMTCIQLIKSGPADQAGMKSGDVFTEFGNIAKESFEGLKSVANLVRRSANKTIQAVVLRRVTGGNKPKKRGAKFRKIRLTLTPSYCHDTDGGGVLGAVINIWPIPVSFGAQE